MNETSLPHIRRPLPRKGGNQFYKSTGARNGYTICGAPVTDLDLSIADGKAAVRSGDWPVCPVCAKQLSSL